MITFFFIITFFYIITFFLHYNFFFYIITFFFLSFTLYYIIFVSFFFTLYNFCVFFFFYIISILCLFFLHYSIFCVFFSVLCSLASRTRKSGERKVAPSTPCSISRFSVPGRPWPTLLPFLPLYCRLSPSPIRPLFSPLSHFLSCL